MAAGGCRRLSSVSRGRELLAAVDTFLLDCDGVLWDGPRVIAGAAELLGGLRALGKRVYFVSNNCSRSRDAVVGKLGALGLQAGPEQVYSTARCSALYLGGVAPLHRKVYVLGSQALCGELRAAGLRVSGGPPGSGEDGEEEEEGLPVSRCTLDPEVGAVLVGYDERFNFVRLAKACSYLRDSRCMFVATNPDPWHPIGGGAVVPGLKPLTPSAVDGETEGQVTCTVRPGTGSLTAAIEVGSGRKAVVIGKPSRFMFDCINGTAGTGPLDPARTLMVGDRLDTDILFGANCGVRTVLTLSGVSTLQEAQDNMASTLPDRQKMVPDFYVDSVNDFLPLLNG
ncbi:pyridoxal phosphate phosphatase-like [Amblyraja radiata]|uniref:pyridoxal phosphate phosphatase-like n=1 Tax=Amblyraja radiata TaxID=386614 RepID=UPI0014027CB5|nr:pyridoxal phosphate phosphatase-like [Amblyraja radiata]